MIYSRMRGNNTLYAKYNPIAWMWCVSSMFYIKLIIAQAGVCRGISVSSAVQGYSVCCLHSWPEKAIFFYLKYTQVTTPTCNRHYLLFDKTLFSIMRSRPHTCFSRCARRPWWWTRNDLPDGEGTACCCILYNHVKADYYHPSCYMSGFRELSSRLSF